MNKDMPENINQDLSDNTKTQIEIEDLNTLKDKKTKIKAEGGGYIEKIGGLGLTIYLWYSWGIDHDFLSFAFVGYLVLVAVVLFIPRMIMFAFMLADRVYTIKEQIAYILFNVVLMYFTIPFVIAMLVGE